MKLTCNIVRDLIPLYEDKVCSEDSRAGVEEHLKQCEACRAYFKRLQDSLQKELWENPTVSEETKAEKEKEEWEKIVVRKGIKKIRQRWVASLIICVLAFIPVSGTAVMGYHEIVQRGVCFSNMDDIRAAKRFVKLIENGDYETAADMQEPASRWRYQVIREKCQDYEKIAEEERTIQEKEYLEKNKAKAEMPEEEFIKQQKESFAAAMKAYEEIGYISGCEVSNIYYESDSWMVEMKVKETMRLEGQEFTKTLIIYKEGEQQVFCTGYINVDASYADYEDSGIIAAITMSGNYAIY